MDILINRKLYRDKVHACWIGKNIGGTMGGPFEGKPDLQDIHGYTTPKGEPLPNDDLDLQLVWLKAIEEVGAKGLNANILSWYWRRFIFAIWNEYGIGCNNVAHGITPPMSGELYNEHWRTSNGAWIRSEIWACLAPGQPNIAAKYAIMEASIDHGVSEGTAAEIFTAALESMAFVETDLRKIVGKALTYIPEDCKVARYVKMVIEEYDKGTDWKEVRQKVVEMNTDLGFFQAPGNIAYVMIGLLYGEGDFLQSLIYAINCGDDADCTAATVGSILGIMGGSASIPEDLKEYIGDRIITKTVDTAGFGGIQKTCSELTEDVLRIMPLMMGENEKYTQYTDKEDAPCVSSFALDCDGYTHRYLVMKPFTTEHSNHWMAAAVSFDGEPRIAPNGELTFEVKLSNKMYNSYHLGIRVMTPSGWTAAHPKMVNVQHFSASHDSNYVWHRRTNTEQTFQITLTANEHTEAFNRVYIAVEATHYPEPLVIPVTVFG